VEGTLYGKRSSNGVRGTFEYHEAAISFAPRPHQRTLVTFNVLVDQLVVPDERRSHRIWVFFPAAGAALDVSEQEGHGPGWQRAQVSS
jgi:hypothetical protein